MPPTGKLYSRFGTLLNPMAAAEWLNAQELLPALLSSYGVTEEITSQWFASVPRTTSNPGKYRAMLESHLDEGDVWQYIESVADEAGNVAVRSLPVARNSSRPSDFLFVEAHSQLIAWWLASAWRSDQLARAIWMLGDEWLLIPASACARSLLETAAAFWNDGGKIHAAWAHCKDERGQAIEETKMLSTAGAVALINEITQIRFAGKFSEKTQFGSHTWTGPIPNWPHRFRAPGGVPRLTQRAPDTSGARES